VDQALARSHEAIALAQELAHPFSQASALAWAGVLHSFRRDVRVTRERAEAAVTLSTEQGFPFRWAEGTLLRGWALALWGEVEEGIMQLRQGIAAWQATGAEIARPWWLALLAEAYGKAGQPEAGLTVLDEALALIHKTGECLWEAGVQQRKGELLLALSMERQAEACFEQALAIARRQQAKSWELRAAVSLSRLWRRQGKRTEAHRLLAPIYGWFTEGFDTADLQAAKGLLEELGT
jgi:predicted ATPase